MISVYVDLAIGLVLAFLLLSLLVSGINEGIVRLLGIRSKFLWAYLRDTLDGAPKGRSWIPSRFLDVFAKLPFSRHDPRPRHDPDPAPPVVEPMPVDPSAVLAEETPAPPVDMTRRLYERLQEIDHPKGARTSIANIPPERFSGALLELVAAEEGGIEDLLAKLEAIRSPLAGHLRGVWEGAQRDMGKFRKGVEDWFDGEMQRLSTLYSRYVRWVVFALALVLTLMFSMDALEYGKTLLRDNSYRAAVAAIASGGGDGTAELKDSLRDKCAVAGSVEPYSCVTEVFSSPALVKIFDHAVMSVTIPADGSRNPSFSFNGGAWWNRLTGLGHWPGYLITVAALMFGASFWWDILRRLTGIRTNRS